MRTLKTVAAILFILLALALAGGEDRRNWSDNPTVTQSMAGGAD